jgi:iron complex outermembrane receptor protein
MISSTHLRGVCAAALTAAFMMPATAYAQTEGATESDEIIVTATKRAESILEVPIAVSVVTGEDIAQRNITGFSDYLTSIPGVQFNPGGQVFSNSISIRGVTDGTSSYLSQQPVALFLDETLLTLSQGGINLDYSLYGIEQINVIKGPNSTLYGASSLGGTVKVVTRKPSLTEFRGEARATLATMRKGGENYNLVGSVSAPLVQDKVGVELTGYYKKFGGYIDDPSRNETDINSSETWGGRLALRFAPSERLTIDLTGYYQKFVGDGLDTFAPETVGDLQTRPLPGAQNQEDEFLLGNLVIDYETDFANLVSATSYFDRKSRSLVDLTNSFINFFPGTPNGLSTTAPAKVFSQELRLVSNGDGPFKWLIGGYYSNEDYREIAFLTAGPPGAFDGDLSYKYDTYAAFAEVGYDIVDRLTFTVGGRYTKYDTSVNFDGAIFFAPTDLIASESENDFSPRIALNYEYGDGSVYAQASRGFRLGQANVPVPLGPDNGVPAFFAPDKLWNYEIGAKTRWLDGQLSVNLAAYYIDWTDIQLTRTCFPCGGFTFIDNVGDARIYGFEMESVAYLTPDTIFTANFGYIDGKLKETVPGVANAGTRLPGSPRYTVSTSLQQNFRMGDNEGFARVDYLYYGPYDDAFVLTGRPFENGDYSKLDLRAGFTFGEFEIGLFATNLLDQRPTLTRTFFVSEDVTTIQPRTFGASVGVKF